MDRKLAAILSADVVGYSRLMEQDEAGTLAALKRHRQELFDPTVAAHRGRTVKLIGDGALVEFGSAVDAVNCAIAIQQAMEAHADEPAGNRHLLLRIGVNLGDVIVDGDDIYGDGVNLSARLEALAEPGGICISGNVCEQIAGKVAAVFTDDGEHHVKNIDRPVRVWHWSAAAGTNAPDSVSADLPLPDKPSVAVLPFVNMSADAEQEFFADGVTEDIITDLSKVSGVFVIGRQSSFVYKGKSVGLKQVGRELGVRYVLEGSVRRAGNRVRITAQLIESSTDNHVWAERYDRDLEDIFAVQEEVARSVVGALSVTLLPDEQERLSPAYTPDLEAYEFFIRGRVAVQPPTKENLAEARRLFAQTVALDPDFAGGYAGLSYVDSLSMTFGHTAKAAETIAQVTELAEKAIALDNTFGFSFAVLGWAKWLDGDHDAAIASAQRAVDLQPGDSQNYGLLGLLMTFGGRPAEAIPCIERALRLDPVRPGHLLNFRGYAQALAGHSRDAIATLLGVPQQLYSPGTYAMLIVAYMESDQTSKAEDAARTALDQFPRITASRWIAAPLKEHERIAQALRKAGIPD